MELRGAGEEGRRAGVAVYSTVPAAVRRACRGLPERSARARNWLFRICCADEKIAGVLWIIFPKLLFLQLFVCSSKQTTNENENAVKAKGNLQLVNCDCDL